MSRKFIGWLSVGLLALGLWAVGFIHFSNGVFKYIGETPELVMKPHQVGVVVLTGGRYRIRKGVELLNEGFGARLLISGVLDGVTLQDIAVTDNVEVYDDMPVDLGYEARTTVGNAKEIKAWVDKNHYQTIYAVTSFYHIPRSRLELEHYMPAVEFKFAAVSSGYVQKQWWKHWGSFKFLAAEYCKYLAVKVQYLFS